MLNMCGSHVEGGWKIKRLISGQNISDAQSMEAAGISHLLLLVNALTLRRSIKIFHPQPPALRADSQHTIHHLHVQEDQKFGLTSPPPAPSP